MTLDQPESWNAELAPPEPPFPEELDPTQKEMSFVEHLGELRRALIIGAIAIVIGAGVGFYYYKPILTLLRQQAGNVQFVILAPEEGFTAVLRLSVLMGLFLGIPVLLREVWWFIGPALTRKQRLVLVPILLVSYLLFLAGVAFAYFALLPIGVKFLIGFTPEGIKPMLSISRYIGFASVLIFSTGLMFQIPIVMLISSLVGALQRSLLVSQRRYAILVSFVVAAVITPSVDMMTQSMLAGTLIILFEMGLILMWFVERIKGKNKPEEEY